MSTQADLDILKDIPGYKAILKSVLKSQIQLLIEQLADHTGEESIILTASINDGTLSHLGSNTGKGFLEGRDEIKSQFLGFCLKSHHRKKTQENHSHTMMSQHPPKRPRIRPVPYSMPPTSSPISSPTSIARPGMDDITNYNQSINNGVKTEGSRRNNADNFLGNVSASSVGDFSSNVPASVHLSHTQTANQNESFGDTSQSSMQDSADGQDSSASNVKLEPESQDDLDIEVTGVELGDNSLSSEAWGQGYGSGPNDSDRLGGDPTGYNSSEQAQGDDASAHPEPLGGIAFPGLDNSHHDFRMQLPEISPSELKQALYPEGDAMFHKDEIFYKSHKLGMENRENMNLHFNTRLHNDYSSATEMMPRRRGRPRKTPVIPVGNGEMSNQHDSQSLTSSPAVKGRRGRPRKELDSLPPGFIRPAGISIGNGYVKCNICGKILKATSMFTHKQAHLGIKNYRCEFCEKSFTQKGPLITHKRIHTGEKPYTCPTCGKLFAAQSGLYQHSRRCPRGHVAANFNTTL